MEGLPACRTSQFGVFTSTQARAAGISRHDLAVLMCDHRIVRIIRSVYAATHDVAQRSPVERSIMRAVATCLVHGEAALSDHSAALVHGLPLLGSFRARPTLTADLAKGHRGGRRQDVQVRRAALPSRHVERRGDWAVTTAARTVCDLARQGGVLAGLVPLDAALHSGLTTLPDVEDAVRLARSWPGGASLMPMIVRASQHAESPAETLARWQLTELGYRPCPQVWAYDDDGPIGCGDLWLGELGVFVEIDGDVKYGAGARPTTLLEEKRRQERLEAAGFGVARTPARDVGDAADLDRRVRRAADVAALARRTRSVCGYVASPPAWADRGVDRGVRRVAVP